MRWAALLLVTVSLAACGESETTDLVIEVRPNPSNSWTSYSLTCHPAPDGSHPTPEAACDVLADLAVEDLAPTKPGQACTMIYGGPQEAKVRGTLHGKNIDATFTRDDGCEIHRWELLGPDVLPVDLTLTN